MKRSIHLFLFTMLISTDIYMKYLDYQDMFIHKSKTSLSATAPFKSRNLKLLQITASPIDTIFISPASNNSSYTNIIATKQDTLTYNLTAL